MCVCDRVNAEFTLLHTSLLFVGELGEACSEEHEQYVYGVECLSGSAPRRQGTA